MWLIITINSTGSKCYASMIMPSYHYDARQSYQWLAIWWYPESATATCVLANCHNHSESEEVKTLLTDFSPFLGGGKVSSIATGRSFPDLVKYKIVREAYVFPSCLLILLMKGISVSW